MEKCFINFDLDDIITETPQEIKHRNTLQYLTWIVWVHCLASLSQTLNGMVDVKICNVCCQKKLLYSFQIIN